MQIDRVDHFVLTVRDVEATCAFYGRVLGLETVTNGARRALQCGRQKINLQQVGQEAGDLRATQPLPGAGDFCLITSLPIEQIAERVRAAGIALEGGPVVRAGALGPMQSVYFRDPDGNLVEVARYPDEAVAG